ncbi:MAG: hypothetical protein ACT443_11250 [Gemmatimonadota bacterium]
MISNAVGVPCRFDAWDETGDQEASRFVQPPSVREPHISVEPDRGDISPIDAAGLGMIAGAVTGVALYYTGALGNYGGPIGNAVIFAGIGALAGVVLYYALE